MQGIALMYGHKGPTDGGALTGVAELLRRTYDGLKEATTRFDKAKADGLAGNLSIYDTSFSHMTLLHDNWLVLVYWEMATAYVDGVAWMHLNADHFPQEAYEFGDKLCDQARAFKKGAIEIDREFANRGKVPMAQFTNPFSMQIDPSLIAGQWSACLAVIDRVAKDFRFISERPVSKRMKDVHEAFRHELDIHFDVVKSLKREWRATSMASNQRDLTIELYDQARKVFEIGQRLWAPYFVDNYVQALKRETTLAELTAEFDPWILTGPYMRRRLEGDARAGGELVKFWESLADRSAVLALSQSVEEALRSRKIRQHTGNTTPDVPWATKYLVRRPVRLGTRDFEPGQLCTYYVYQDESGKTAVDVRGSGRLVGIVDLLGQER